MWGYKEKSTLYVHPAEFKHKRTLIFMHSLANFPQEFKAWFKKDGPLHFTSLKVVLPTAPIREIQGMEGVDCFSWYDFMNCDNFTFEGK